MTKLCLPCSDTQVNIAPISVKIDNMAIESLGRDPDDILKEDEAFNLSVDVHFSGPGTAALLPLGLPVTVIFSAESIGPGPEVDLGKATVKTECGKNDYTVTLKVAANSLSAEHVYKLAATLRVGASNCPALVNGFISGGAIEIYNP
jgi:hypothetical protein